MTDIKGYSEKTFEEIKHYTEEGVEFWYARELQKVLEYTQWRNFKVVIEKAKISCENSKNRVSDHFADISKTINMPKGAQKDIDDIMLSRYAGYLIVQNGDSRKEVIALARVYELFYFNSRNACISMLLRFCSVLHNNPIFV